MGIKYREKQIIPENRQIPSFGGLGSVFWDHCVLCVSTVRNSQTRCFFANCCWHCCCSSYCIRGYIGKANRNRNDKIPNRVKGSS